MTLDTAALRTHVWRTEECPTSFCRQPAGRRCIDRDGNRTTPHPARVAAAGVRLMAQLDTALHDLDAATDQVGTLSDDVRDAMGRLHLAEDHAADLADQLKTARIGAALVPGLQQQIADLLAKIADLEKPKPPTTLTTRFGACPRKGGETLAAAQTVIAKWGKGAAVRQFLGTGVAPRPADAGIVHVSWKPTLDQITDAWVAKVTANLLAGDCVEVWHEADSKVRKGNLQRADVVARKNTFYAAVKRVRPDLRVVNTLTGWLFDPASKLDAESWVVDVAADVLGVDCDGVRPTKLPYTNYEAETQAVLALAEKHGIKHVAVPEFGCPRIPAADPDGSLRTAYHDHYADLWSGRFLFVTLYEYDSSPNYSLSTPAELSGWKAHVA